MSIFQSFGEKFLGRAKPGLEFIAPPQQSTFKEGERGKGLFRAKSGLTLFREKPDIEMMREDDECLPDDWEVLFDPDVRHEYYYNKRTGESTWERPVPMQPLVQMKKSRTPSEVSQKSRDSSKRNFSYKEEARNAPPPEDRGRIPTEGTCFYLNFLHVAAAELRNNRIERPSRQKRPLWRVIRRECGVTDQEIAYFLRNPETPGIPHSDIHYALNTFYDENTNPKEKTIEELINFSQQFEKESVLQAQAICKFDPLDFIDVVRERWQLTNLPCDKTSLNQICCAFVGILSLRDVTDARRVVREETGPLSTADPKTKILANQNPPKKGL